MVGSRPFPSSFGGTNSGVARFSPPPAPPEPARVAPVNNDPAMPMFYCVPLIPEAVVPRMGTGAGVPPEQFFNTVSDCEVTKRRGEMHHLALFIPESRVPATARARVCFGDLRRWGASPYAPMFGMLMEIAQVAVVPKIPEGGEPRKEAPEIAYGSLMGRTHPNSDAPLSRVVFQDVVYVTKVVVGEHEVEERHWVGYIMHVFLHELLDPGHAISAILARNMNMVGRARSGAPSGKPFTYLLKGHAQTPACVRHLQVVNEAEWASSVQQWLLDALVIDDQPHVRPDVHAANMREAKYSDLATHLAQQLDPATGDAHALLRNTRALSRPVYEADNKLNPLTVYHPERAVLHAQLAIAAQFGSGEIERQVNSASIVMSQLLVGNFVGTRLPVFSRFDADARLPVYLRNLPGAVETNDTASIHDHSVRGMPGASQPGEYPVFTDRDREEEELRSHLSRSKKPRTDGRGGGGMAEADAQRMTPADMSELERLDPFVTAGRINSAARSAIHAAYQKGLITYDDYARRMDVFKQWGLHELHDYFAYAEKPQKCEGHAAVWQHYLESVSRTDDPAAARFLSPIEVVDPELSPFASVMVWLTTSFEKICNMYQGHFVLLLGLFIVIEAQRCEYNLHHNLALIGQYAAGKSNLLTMLKNLSIAGIVREICGETPKSWAGQDVNFNNIVALYSETPNSYKQSEDGTVSVGGGRVLQNPGNCIPASELKEMMTSGMMHTRSNAGNDKDGKRSLVHALTLVRFSRILCSNCWPFEKSALSSRIAVQIYAKDARDDSSIPAAQASERKHQVDYDDKRKTVERMTKDTEMGCSFIEAAVGWGIFEAPDISYATAIFNNVCTMIRKMLGVEVETRARDRFLNIVRAATVAHAWFHYAVYMTPTMISMMKKGHAAPKFNFVAALRMCEIGMVANHEHVTFALGLLQHEIVMDILPEMHMALLTSEYGPSVASRVTPDLSKFVIPGVLEQIALAGRLGNRMRTHTAYQRWLRARAANRSQVVATRVAEGTQDTEGTGFVPPPEPKNRRSLIAARIFFDADSLAALARAIAKVLPKYSYDDLLVLLRNELKREVYPIKRDPLTGRAIMDPQTGRLIYEDTPVPVLMDVYASDCEPPGYEAEISAAGAATDFLPSAQSCAYSSSGSAGQQIVGYALLMDVFAGFGTDPLAPIIAATCHQNAPNQLALLGRPYREYDARGHMRQYFSFPHAVRIRPNPRIRLYEMDISHMSPAVRSLLFDRALCMRRCAPSGEPPSSAITVLSMSEADVFVRRLFTLGMAFYPKLHKALCAAEEDPSRMEDVSTHMHYLPENLLATCRRLSGIKPDQPSAYPQMFIDETTTRLADLRKYADNMNEIHTIVTQPDAVGGGGARVEGGRVGAGKRVVREEGGNTNTLVTFRSSIVARE